MTLSSAPSATGAIRPGNACWSPCRARRPPPVSQQARLRISVWVRRDDGTGDIDAAQNLAADIELYLTGLYPPRPVVTIDHESGPIRMSDENGCLMAYLTLLLTVETNQA